MEASEFARKMEALGEEYGMPKGHVLNSVAQMGQTGMEIKARNGVEAANMYFALQYQCAAKHLKETRPGRAGTEQIVSLDASVQGLPKSSSSSAE